LDDEVSCSESSLRVLNDVVGEQVLVTGATGFIGPCLVHRLVDHGCAVRVLARRVPPPGLFPECVSVEVGDICDPGAVEAAVAGCSRVFHLAAMLRASSRSSSPLWEYRSANIAGSKIVATAAINAGVGRVIFYSTVAVYGPSAPGQVHDEESPPLATTLYGYTKREAEKVLMPLTSAGGEALCVTLRIAAVYGRSTKGSYHEFVRWLRRGLFVPVGDGNNRRTIVHEEDVADAAVLAAWHPAAAGRTYNVTDGQIYTTREIVRSICVQIGRRPPRIHVPVSAASRVARVVDSGMVALGLPVLAVPLLEKLTEDRAVNGMRIQQELGFRPRFDLRAGWEATKPRQPHEISTG
jgi:nucleoside-diphosphate-sugar epimerase